jgi:hypothetical protein
VVVVLLEERFFVPDERSVVFFDVDFTVVAPGFETVLLAVLAGVLLAVLAGVLLAVFAVVLLAVPTADLLVGREVDVADRLAAFPPPAPVDAIANIRGADVLAGLVARTSRMALVCSSSVIRNS